MSSHCKIAIKTDSHPVVLGGCCRFRQLVIGNPLRPRKKLDLFTMTGGEAFNRG
jgi:hypothetical protein